MIKIPLGSVINAIYHLVSRLNLIIKTDSNKDLIKNLISLRTLSSWK